MRRLLLALALSGCDAPLPGPTPHPSDEPPAPEAPVVTAPDAFAEQVIEERAVEGDGGAVWRLIFTTAPVLDCLDASFHTCRCMALEFGQRGHVVLERARAGSPPERLDLGLRTIPRWPELPDDRLRFPGAPDVEEVLARAPVPAMVFADYDHDGRATEFLLVGYGDACGDHAVIAVGISRLEPNLHVFSLGGQPLSLMHAEDWESVRKKVPVEVPVQPCGWHGWPVHDVLRLSVDAHGLTGRHRRYRCVPYTGQPKGALMFDHPWIGHVPSDLGAIAAQGFAASIESASSSSIPSCP